MINRHFKLYNLIVNRHKTTCVSALSAYLSDYQDFISESRYFSLIFPVHYSLLKMPLFLENLMKYNKLILNIENDPIINKLFSTVIALIPQIPALEKLIEQATQNGPITVDFVNKDQTHTNGSWEQRGTTSWEQHGKIITHHKTIERFIKVVKQGQTFTKMFETLIFELCNAKNPHFELYSDNAITSSKFDDRDSYAYATEQAEYTQTHIPSRAILKAIFSDPKSVKAFQDKGIKISPNELKHLTSDAFHSFQDWWKHVNQPIAGRSYSHSDIYRQDFDRRVGQPLPNPVPAPIKPIHIQSKPLIPALANKQQMKVVPVNDELQKKLNLRLTKIENKPPLQPAPAIQPAPMVQKPAPAVQKPAPAVQKPAPAVQKPAPAVQKPAPAVQKPAPAVQKPVAQTPPAQQTPIQPRPELKRCHPAQEFTLYIRLPAGVELTQQELEVIQKMALEQFQSQAQCFRYKMMRQRPHEGRRHHHQQEEAHCHRRHRCYGQR